MRSTKQLGVMLLMCAAYAIAGCSGRTEHSADGASAHDVGVRLSPDPASVGSELAVEVEIAGVDPGQCRYTWRRNGQPIPGASESVLTPTHFAKGDRIQVEVLIPARGDRTEQTLSAESRIVDSAPTVLSARLVLNASAAGTSLQVHPECSDPDGDAITCTYTWLRNGQRIEGATDSTLSVSGFSRSDKIVAEVVALAGGMASPARASEEFQLDNRPPAFSSQPVGLAPGELAFRYQALATDPDGDALSYELLQAPTGMTIGPTGALEWVLPKSGAGPAEYAVRIRAVDAKGGEATQDFTLRVAAQSSASDR